MASSIKEVRVKRLLTDKKISHIFICAIEAIKISAHIGCLYY